MITPCLLSSRESMISFDCPVPKTISRSSALSGTNHHYCAVSTLKYHLSSCPSLFACGLRYLQRSCNTWICVLEALHAWCRHPEDRTVLPYLLHHVCKLQRDLHLALSTMSSSSSLDPPLVFPRDPRSPLLPTKYYFLESEYTRPYQLLYKCSTRKRKINIIPLWFNIMQRILYSHTGSASYKTKNLYFDD
jgi:hypothetical protein